MSTLVKQFEKAKLYIKIIMDVDFFFIIKNVIINRPVHTNIKCIHKMCSQCMVNIN